MLTNLTNNEGFLIIIVEEGKPRETASIFRNAYCKHKFTAWAISSFLELNGGLRLWMYYDPYYNMSSLTVN